MRHFQTLCNWAGGAAKSLIRPENLQISIWKYLRFQKTGFRVLNKEYGYR